MRIISGIRRGHKLIGFEGNFIRPTTDRVKENIFNLIATSVPESNVLDLFAGSGALSFEAISRGAENAVCIDTDKRSIDIIHRNADALDFADKVLVKKYEALTFLAETDKKFDIIFLDPPYNKGFVKPVMDSIVKHGLLSEHGIIMLESDYTDDHCSFDGLEIYRQRKYGRTYVTIYKSVD